MSGDGTIIQPVRGTDPGAPAAGKFKLYPKSDGYHQIDEAGVVTKIGPAVLLRSFSAALESTTGTTKITKGSIVIPAEDATWIIEATALVKFSNTTGNPAIRMFNTTDAAQLGRDWISEMQDSANILGAIIKQEFTNTLSAGAKTIALQYFLSSGVGTLSISDAMISARKL